MPSKKSISFHTKHNNELASLMTTGFASATGLSHGATRTQFSRTFYPNRKLAPPPAPRRARAHVAHCCAAAAERSTSVPSSALHGELIAALSGMNRGLEIDADATESAAESRVEDAIEALEALNRCASPSTDELRFGDWELAYTSSPLTRFSGGLTGLQKFLPGGLVGRIALTADADDATWEFRETLFFDVLGKEFEAEARVGGRVRALSDVREAWTPEKIKVYFLSFFADTWKTLRAFQVVDVTYLDEYVKICRGQTGSTCVFVRPEIADKID